MAGTEIGVAIDLGRGPHLRQHFTRDIQRLQHHRVPVQLVDVVEHGARSVGVIGHVCLALGHLPDQPAVDGTEQEFATTGAFTAAFDMVEDPLDLGAGEVRVDDQAGGLANVILHAVTLELVADRRALAALPDDGVVDRPACDLVPDDGGFALVSDADGGNLFIGDPGLGQRFDEHAALGRPDFHGIMLDPAWLRVDLCKFALSDGHHVGVAVEHDGAGAGGALVKGDDELLVVLVAHGVDSLTSFVGSDIVFGEGLGLGLSLGDGARSASQPWQMFADQRLVTGRTNAGTQHRGEQRDQEIRNVASASKCDFAPTGEICHQLRSEIPRWIHRKTGQRTHRAANHGNQQTD